eukprot:774648_1
MSLFDPLYEIEVKPPPTLAEISKIFSEHDGSGTGLMTPKKIYEASKSISNLGFSDVELQNYVKEGMDVAGDDNGRIKMNEFASYLAFEAKKKYKKTQTKSPNNTNNNDYVNPFDAFVNPPQPTKTKSMKVTITADPNQSIAQANAKKVDMTASLSPTEADPTDLPNWFGHSENTILTHPNEPTPADPFSIFDDDNKTNGNGNDNRHKPHHISIATQDILYDEVGTTASSNGNGAIDKSGTLSPKKASSMKKGPHKTSKSSTGLLPAPRSKGDKPKSKKKKSNKGKHSGTLSGSFMNSTFGRDDFDINRKKKKDRGKDSLRLKKSHSEMIPESTHTLKSRIKPEEVNGKKKKRPKIDAIDIMKRGAAMLKYGRRGFPHFRRFQISHDLTKLLWYSRKKSLNETHVSIKEMKDILDGQQTEVFKQCTQKTLEKASFSIIYGSKLKSLDVVAKSAEEAALWIKGLKGLIKANQQGKLHKVVQILVDVDFKDISKTKYRQCTDDERRKYDIQHKNRAELVHTVATTLQQSRKIFQSLTKLSTGNNVMNSNEYNNIQTLTSELEERLEEIEFGLHNKTADLTDLKRDVWVLKVDVTVLEEKVKVLSKIKTAIPI